MLKSLFLPLFALATLLSAFFACNNDDTYADLREKENKQIDSFLKRGRTLRNADNTADLFSVAPNIKVISETQFYAQDSTTNVAQNEYVLLAGSGVYLQILRKGTGEKIKQGETLQVICRFTEFDIAADTLTLSNVDWRYEQWPEIMTVTNRYGTYTASFLSGLMARTYGAIVPSGWLQPLPFLRLGRQSTSQGEIAKVRLIIPSTEGQRNATRSVHPYFYEITYQRAR